MKNKLLILIIIVIGAGVGIGYTIIHSHSKYKKVLSAQANVLSLQVTPQPTMPPGIPQTISIPKINVHATVESVGMDSQGRMDVPKNAVDTAWYKPGYKPGMKGSAVIDGHLDRVTGAPAVFWNLKELTPGDRISVAEDNGKTYTFTVTQISRYPDANFPIKEVFAASDVPMLNLITCNGTWDKNTKNYSDRLVVYSKLVSQN